MTHAVDIHPALETELAWLSRCHPREHAAIQNARFKLEARGTQLGFPHSSTIRSANAPLRELRPRQGRSPWRVLYATRPRLVMLALAPEAQHDLRRFAAAVRAAEARLAEQRP